LELVNIIILDPAYDYLDSEVYHFSTHQDLVESMALQGSDMEQVGTY
jgi:hypothetical protein